MAERMFATAGSVSVRYAAFYFAASSGAICFAAGCGESRTPDAVATRRDGLSGDAGLFTNCDGGVQAGLEGALRLAHDALSSPVLLTWLLEEQFEGPAHSGVNGPEWGTGYPEWIAKRMNEPIDTAITCWASGPGAARNDIEQIYMPNRSSSTLSDLAGLIAHEVAHTKGFDHPFSYTWYNINSFLMEAVPALLAGVSRMPIRSAEPQETTLAPVGNDDLWGYPDQICEGTRFAAGIFGYVMKTETGDSYPPSGIAFYCAPAGGLVDIVTEFAGRRDGDLVPTSCAYGQILVGAYGHATSTLQSIGGLCAYASGVLAGPVVPFPEFEIGNRNDPSAVSWRRQCPTGMAVKGMRVREEDFISRVEIICQSVATAETITLTDWMGLPVGTFNPSVLDRCPGRHALNGLQASYSDSPTSPRIYRLEGKCRRIVGTGASAKLEGTQLRVPGYGDGPFTKMASAWCPNDYPLLVGLGLNVHGLHIGGVRGVCANAAKWADDTLPIGGATFTLPPWGNPGGEWSHTYCARGEYLNGWWISDLDGVTGISGICRPFTLGATVDAGLGDAGTETDAGAGADAGTDGDAGTP